MKKIYFVLVLLFAFTACDEGGILISVPYTGSYQFDIKSNQANASASHSFTAERTIEPSALVTENSESIKNITLNKFNYEVVGYSGGAGNPVLMDLSLSTVIGGVTTEIMSATGVTLTNGVFTAFEKGKTSSLISAAQVASLEAIIDNQEPFNLIVTTGFDNDIASDFSLKVIWDITASIAQSTN
ncbi:hypothetical protein ACV07N_05595 [Roseivirga echinicomitans]